MHRLFLVSYSFFVFSPLEEMLVTMGAAAMSESQHVSMHRSLAEKVEGEGMGWGLGRASRRGEDQREDAGPGGQTDAPEKQGLNPHEVGDTA